ncbi:MAG: hypothetical protein MRY63_10850 [Neomegalonema sp.]|nr:hypothetical protein [Neomegalonema sp.]
MKKLIAALLLSGTALFGAQAQAEEAEKVLTIVTSDNAQTQLMSMVLTMQAIKKGASAQVLLCGAGGDLALKDAPESATAPQAPKGMSPQGLMQMIMSKGGKVEVCAIYLPNKGLGAEALLDGITAAKPPVIAEQMLDDDTTVLTF